MSRSVMRVNRSVLQFVFFTKSDSMIKTRRSTPLPRKVGLPEWKQFWRDKSFAAEMWNKRILNDIPHVVDRIFHVGPYFMVVVNYGTMGFEYVMGVSQMLGFSTQQFYDGKHDFLVGLIHPHDKEKVLGLAVHYYNFLDAQPRDRRLDFKVSINFRMRKANGEYISILEQVVALNMDEQGRVTHVLEYFTDISHLNYSKEVVFSILDDKGEEGQQFYTFDLEEKKVPGMRENAVPTFSDREREILTCIAAGMTSKEIAGRLHISAFTVNKHRENMMRKTGGKNMNEVLSFAYCNEYL